jgi:DNA-directed RNA polymerase subunit RPC12/RpoP
MFPMPSPRAPSLLARSTPSGPTPAAPAATPNRTLLAEPEAMIRYTCPRCKKSLESPAAFAGQKLHCPDCNQRLQIPRPSASPPPPNKTILAEEEPPISSRGRPAPFSSQPANRDGPGEDRDEVLEVIEDDSSATGHDYCLECGVDVTRQARVQSCPDCGSLFCSARCFREHRYYAHAPRRESRPRFVECYRCGSSERPYFSTVISEGGWVTFAVLLVLFFPLCWIGLLMTETRGRCADCGARVR